ncbi:MAG: hypothetical protein RSC00_02790 [Ruthenibacterium sp.]
MFTAIVCFWAIASTAAFLALWLWTVCRDLRQKRDTMESAALQVALCRKKRAQTQDDDATQAALVVLTRSEDIFYQSVRIYNAALRRPQNCIPGLLLGFRPRETEDHA